MRRAFTLIELLVVIAIILVLCGCLMPGSLQGLIAFLFGWVLYPIRIFRERDIDWPTTLLCATCLGGLTLGVHVFGRWFAAHRATTWPWSRSFKLIGLVMLMFLAGIVGIGITHEVVWLATTKEPLGSRFPAAYQMQSRNNLKMLGLGAHSYHDVHKRTLPAGGTFDANGRAMHGWQTMLLPYVDGDAIFKKVDFTVPWNDARNAAAIQSEVSVFMNPAIFGSPPKGFAPSHYAGNVQVLRAAPMNINDITDGTSNTLMMGEVAQDFKPWAMPMNCRDPANGLNRPDGFGHPYGKHVQLLFVDGTVRVIRPDISPTVLKALATPRGGEKFDPHHLD